MFRYAIATLSLYPLCADYVNVTLAGENRGYLASLLLGIESRFEDLKRIEIVDSMRGLLLYWMLVSHSLQQAGVPAGHWLQWLRPRGWMSPSFVMLTGIAVALIYGVSRRSSNDIAKKTFRRTVQILLIAFVTNGLSVLWRDRSLQAVIDSSLFRAPWSISQYLLPTAFVMISTPWLVTLVRRFTFKQMLSVLGAGIIAVNLTYAIWSVFEPDAAFLVWIGGSNGILEVSLLTFTAASFVAFGLGLALARKRINAEIWMYITVTSLAYVISADDLLVLMDGPGRAIYETGLYIARFVLILQLTHVLLLVRHSVVLRGFLRLTENLGRNSLFVFIFHRPVCQVAGILSRQAVGSAELRLLLIAGSTITLLVAANWLRRVIPIADKSMTMIGL